MAAPVLATLPPRRLVLCFDGTRNKFTGDETDTNIVKIYKMLDRGDPNQFHYYQPGIGSYVEGRMSNTSKGHYFARFKDWCTETIDEAFGTSFVDHVIAGYKFLMRFYKEGDKIYIFGFSRGAYTARYLSEMIQEIGLLSQGNEEMIRFAWNSYGDHKLKLSAEDFLENFKDTVCRKEVKVHFLGLFDCVNSVAHIQGAAPHEDPTEERKWPAEHVRHAVSSHERRVMFLPALFLLNPCANVDPRVKEVYFAGNHGDVGGGWGHEKLSDGTKPEFLLSDIALKWMVDEVTKLDKDLKHLQDKHKGKLHEGLKWKDGAVDMRAEEVWLKEQLELVPKDKSASEDSPARKIFHDPVSQNRGSNWISWLFWWILEISPFTAYSSYDCTREEWVIRRWAPHFGAIRDIPAGVSMHKSIQELNRAGIIVHEEVPEAWNHKMIWDPAGRSECRLPGWSGKQHRYVKISSPKLA